MRFRCAIAVTCLVLGTLTTNGQALAHGTEEHDKMSPEDAPMMKLHGIMPMFAVASAKLKTALEKGDTDAVEVEAGKILKAIPDLKKSRPHKNIKHRKDFALLAANLDKTVTSTLVSAKKGDFAGARAAFKKVEEQCAACHAKFRD